MNRILRPHTFITFRTDWQKIIEIGCASFGLWDYVTNLEIKGVY